MVGQIGALRRAVGGACSIAFGICGHFTKGEWPRIFSLDVFFLFGLLRYEVATIAPGVVISAVWEWWPHGGLPLSYKWQRTDFTAGPVKAPGSVIYLTTFQRLGFVRHIADRYWDRLKAILDW